MNNLLLCVYATIIVLMTMQCWSIHIHTTSSRRTLLMKMCIKSYTFANSGVCVMLMVHMYVAKGE